MYAPDVYVLTDITRRSSEQRRVVVSGFDVRWRSVVMCMIGTPPGLMLVGIGWVFLGQYALLLLPLTIVGLFVLVDGKSKAGLGLPLWRTLLDRKQSSVGKFFMCGVEIDPLDEPIVNIVLSTVPVEHDRRRQHEEALGIRY